MHTFFKIILQLLIIFIIASVSQLLAYSLYTSIDPCGGPMTKYLESCRTDIFASNNFWIGLFIVVLLSSYLLVRFILHKVGLRRNIAQTEPIPQNSQTESVKQKSYLLPVLIALFITLLVSAGGFYLYQKQINLLQLSVVQIQEMKPTGLRCDLNEDSKCDQTDFSQFMKAFGSKRGDSTYNPLADADADGIVTSIDAQLLQFPFAYTLPAYVSQTANLKIHTDSTYGFSISYDNSFASEPRTSNIGGVFQLCVYSVGGQEKPCSVSVDVYDNKQNFSLEQWTNSYATPIQTYGGNAKPTKGTFNGYPAMVVANEGERVSYVSQGAFIYKIRNVADAPPAEVANTFKFTNQATETANWKSFTFSDGSFSFKYPASWQIENPNDGIGYWINFFPSGSPQNHTTNSVYGTEIIRLIDYGDGGDLQFSNFRNQGQLSTVGGKQAMENVGNTSASVDILVKKLTDKSDRILHLEFQKNSLPYINQILATFKFISQ